MSCQICSISEFFKPRSVEIYENIEGSCVVCGRKTAQGHKTDYSSNFTLWSLLQAGNCICPECYELTRNQKYRRSMWVANEEEIIFFKKKDMLEHILNPPKPPFAMYLTKTWQKQGFFKLINKVNYSRENYFTALDMEIFFVNRHVADKMASFGEELRDRGLTKKELKTGEVLAYRYKEFHISQIEKLKKYAKQKLWRLIVYAIN